MLELAWTSMTKSGLLMGSIIFQNFRYGIEFLPDPPMVPGAIGTSFGIEYVVGGETKESMLFGYGGPIIGTFSSFDSHSISFYAGTIWGLKQTIKKYKGPFVSVGITFPQTNPLLGVTMGLFGNMEQHGVYTGFTLQLDGIPNPNRYFSSNLTYFMPIEATYIVDKTTAKKIACLVQLLSPSALGACLKSWR